MNVCHAIGLVALAGQIALAGTPRIHAERCASLDGPAIEAALFRELAFAPATARADLGDLGIDIVCTDPVHAEIRVGDGAVREVDLADEPAALRVKLVALAIIEELDIREPQLVAAVETTLIVAPAREHESVSPPARAPSAHEVTVRGGVRVIAWDRDVLTTLGAELDLGPLRIGMVAALGPSHEPTGTPYLFAVSLSRTLACSHGDTMLCLVARADLGLYGVSLTSREAQVMTTHLYTDYSDLSIGVEARRDALGVRWLAGVELGAGDGMFVEEPYLERVDGPFVSTTFGASW